MTVGREKASEPGMMVDCSIPGGNIIVKSISGSEARLDRDIRDSEGDWFYWEFSAVFKCPGRYTFKLDRPVIGTRGPAVSRDSGLTWEWLGRNAATYDEHSFSYDHNESAGGPVLFCVGMQYQQINLDAFLAAHADPHGPVTKETLCRTRKGREVELLRAPALGRGDSRKILVTARHHCCEMTADYVLEGMLAEAVENADAHRSLDVFAVPFVDKDGVVDGDQGKNRKPHDHARDYGSSPIYPETAAIMNLTEIERFDFILDIHCPWLRGNGNEHVFFVGQKAKRLDAATTELAGLLRKEAEGLGVYGGDILPFGSSWNTGSNFTKGSTLAGWASGLDFVAMAASMEVPYANAGETTFNPDLMRMFGRALARAFAKLDRQTLPK